ncbi:MAG: hypothetical protein AAFY33_02250 [Cyanobacteria bacterium J06643_4]
MKNSTNTQKETAGICLSWIKQTEKAGICLSWIDQNGPSSAQRPTVSLSLENIEEAVA